MRLLYCKTFHKSSCVECKRMTEYGCDILKHGVVDLPTIYRKHFGSYEWDKAMRRTVQLPVVIFCVQLGGSGNKISYVTNFQVNIDYKKYVDWYGRMFSISNKEKSQLNSSQLKAICKLATTESDQLLIKYAVCESSGLSVKKAKQKYGIDEYQSKKQNILGALQKSHEIRTAVSELSALQDKALLRSVGICIADSDSNSSDDDSDDCIDHEQSVVDPNEISSGNDVHVIVSEIVEDMINNFQVLDESNYMKKQNICEISDEAETLLDKDLCCDSLESCSRTRETPPEKSDSNKVTLSFHPDSGLKGQPLANPCLSNDLLMSWLREHNLNWFALVREICQYLKNYSDEVINQCLTDFSIFLPDSDLSEEEEKVVEISRQAYLDFCRNTTDNASDLSDTDSESDGEVWVDIDSLGSEKIPELVRKEMKSRKRKQKRAVAKQIAESRLLKRKFSKCVSRTLQKYPNVGKDIEKYVSDRRVGADQWRRTGVLTFTGNARRGPKVTYSSIKKHLESLYNTNFAYGTVVQLCVVRNKRRLSAKRYQGVANVTCRRARKGFSIKLNPDSHWSAAFYKGLDWIQLQDGRDKVLLNRDDQAGFRLDTTSTHKIGKSINLQHEPTLTTRTDFVNSYKSVLQTSSYLFMETKTTSVGCVGIVKDHFSYIKCPAQHMADLYMLEADPEVNVYLRDKPVDCVRVDGASDEGPAHVEVQFLWGERHYKLGKMCTLITTRESGGSFLNKVELMNGCIAKAHANLFIPSTLKGSNKNEKGLDEEKIKENMEVAADVYLSNVDGAPCFGTTLVMKKGSKNEELINRRKDVLAFLKGKRKEKTQLKTDKPELLDYLERVQKMIDSHTVKQYQSKYIFMLLPCFKLGCIHPVCKKGRLESHFDDLRWFPGGPKLTYVPIPIPDEDNVGHYLSPEKNYEKTVSVLLDSEEVKTFQPPSEIMKKAYLAGNVNETELSTRTLLPVEELHMHLEAMNEITERRKEGAKKAMATRKKKVKDVPGDSEADINVQEDETNNPSPTFCWCKGPDEGDLIYCDGPDCSIGWFHFPCVGIYFAPSGKWLCPDCQTDKNTFCFCNQGEYGIMIKCSKTNCTIQYFHLDCVGLKRAKRRFVCQDCLKEGKA